MRSDEDRTDSEFRRTLLSSFRSATAGWWRAVCSERNLRIHLVASIIVCAACWSLQMTRTDICLIVVAVALVWITELLNTAMERIVDLVSPDYSVLARDAKDIAAAAVLTAAGGAVVIGVLVFGPHLANVVTAVFGGV